jgi:TATA-box binding protein (TBP) (component of TFIID and TFIIIB)
MYVKIEPGDERMCMPEGMDRNKAKRVPNSLSGGTERTTPNSLSDNKPTTVTDPGPNVTVQLPEQSAQIPRSVVEGDSSSQLVTTTPATNQEDGDRDTTPHPPIMPIHASSSSTEAFPGPQDHLTDDTPLTTIHNLVGTSEIAASVTPIDLEHVFRCLPNSFYDRKRFAAITIRVCSPVCTALLFTSGKLVLTGCKSLIECTLASLKVARMLQRYLPGVSFHVRNMVVQNVVAHVVIPLQKGQRLNIQRMYEEHACNCKFDFPA